MILEKLPLLEIKYEGVIDDSIARIELTHIY
jgi:hypothetical protein